jgi:ADP-ribose pyrophosphatase
VTHSSYAIDSPYLRLRKDRIELTDGTVIDDYYVRESRGYVIVFAITPDHRVVLVRQYKHGIARELLELIAGAIDEDEAAATCATRELAEETGYTGDPPQHVRSFVTEPTNSNAIGHLFIVRNARPTQMQALDVTEKIDVELATYDELLTFVRNGTIDSSPHVAAIYCVLDLLKKL